MSSDKNKEKTGLVTELRNYADLRFDELKLRATKGLSTAFSQILVYLLIIAMMIMVLGLLAFALLQWLNSLLGAPWGTLCVCAVFVVLLVILYLSRGRLFRDKFVKLFIDVFYDGGSDE